MTNKNGTLQANGNRQKTNKLEHPGKGLARNLALRLGLCCVALVVPLFMTGCALTGSSGNATVGSVAPQSVRAGSPGQAITVTGTNFTLTSQVNVNGNPRSTTFIGTTKLSAVLLSSDLSQAGTLKITVSDAGAGGVTISNAFSLSVAPPLLKVLTTSLPAGVAQASYVSNIVVQGGVSPYTWKISAGALPPGLSLSGTTGAIFGVPNQTGQFAFTVTATDPESTPQIASQAFNVAVTAAPVPLAMTSASVPNGITQIPYSVALAATGGSTPYVWSISSGTLPAGVTLNPSTGVLSGTPTTKGTYAFGVQVRDSSPVVQSASANFSVMLVDPLQVATSSLPGGQVQANYNTTLAPSGGMAPYAWSITSGTLPPGLSLNSSTGVLSGTPTTTGSYSFTVQVTDPPAIPQTASRTLAMTVAPPALQVTTSSLASGQMQVAYSATLAASGGTSPDTWSITVGSLPAGLSLNASTGVISGTPTSAGTSSFTVQARDSATTAQTATKALSITTAPAALQVTTSSLASGQMQVAYSATLAASGGTSPYTWSVTVGSLPAGLSLNASTGVISGTPTSAGTSSFTVQARDSATTAQTATKALSIAIAPATLQVTTSSLASGQMQVAYSATLAASGGTSPYTWSVTVGSLPAGLSLNASTGVISGTPTSAGTFSFTVQARDSATTAQTATRALSIAIAPATLQVSTSSLASGQMQVAYSTTLAASGGTSPYTWSVTVGSLPAGLSLNASTGVISGTPTSAGTSSFTVQARDSATTAQTATKALSIAIAAATLQVTTSSLAGGQVQVAYNATLAASGGTGPYTWGINGGALPAGMNLNSSTGVISGTPTTAGTASFTVQALDSGSPTQTATQALSITVAPATLQVTTSSLTSGQVASAYSATLAASGGTTPYTWTVTIGSLPAGLSLNSSTGVISGMPTTAGNFSFTVRATDGASVPQSASKQLAISIGTAVVPLSVNAPTLPGGITQTAYPGATLTATGGTAPYTWIVATGALPPGLNLSTSTGAISGTPTTTGNFNFTVQAMDSAASPQTATASASIMIVAPLVITTTSIPTPQLQVPYSVTLTFTGGMAPYTWSISSGSLPPGLSLGSSTGVISGTPTASGAYSFTVLLTDPPNILQTDTQFLSTTVPPPALQISTSSLAGGQVQAAYSATLAASGGTSPYTWSVTVGSLPAGLSLNASTGVISGTPTTAGTSSFTVQARDSATTAQTAANALSITIAPATLQVTTSSLASGQVQAAYSATLAASGGTSPYTWSVTLGSLPAGLSLSASTGVISGTPTSAGSFSFTVQARDSATTAQTATKALSITVAPATLQVATSSLAGGQVSVAYSAALAASGGTPPYTWSITAGSLPAGLSLNVSTGVISGTPTTSGTASFTVQARDSATTAQTATKALSIAVAPATFQVTTSSLAGGQVQSAYSATLAASGGTSPYTWSVTVGSLPAGLSLSASTGVISGTPTSSGTSSFTVQARDSATSAQMATKALSITVAPATLQVTTSSLANGQVQAVYSATLAASGGTSPYTWSVTVGSLPAGLSLNASTGVISGTPTTAGTSSFTVQARDSATTTQTATKALSIIVATQSQTLTITTTTLPTAQTNLLYSTTLQLTGGTPSYAWSITAGSLPAGLQLMASSGIITGTPSTTGQSNFTVRVVDSSTTQQSATASLSITVSNAPALDQYGGLTSLPANDGGSGWRLHKYGNRWLFVDPAGNGFMSFGVWAVVNSGLWENAKYGTNDAWGANTVLRLKSWGFNTLWDHTYGTVRPETANPNKMPASWFQDGASYPARNVNNYCTQGAKLISNGMNQTYYTGYLAPSTDPYDPCFTTWHQKYFAPATAQADLITAMSNDYIMGWSSGESDYMWGFGPGADFVTVPPGHDVAHLGWMVLATKPTQSSGSVNGVNMNYADTTVYAKAALVTFLTGRYGTIGALNTAWASTYTTFGSTGTWGTGTGLLDEDGRHAWMGNFGTLAGETATMKVDLNDFLFQYASKFFSVQRTAFKANYPNKLYFGPNSIGSWGTPPAKPIIQAAALYIDALQTNIGTGAPDDQARMDFLMQYFGDKPVLQWMGFPANPDSALCGSGGHCTNPPTYLSTSTQAQRGANFSTIYNWFANYSVSSTVTGGAANSKPIIGVRWWAWVDSVGESTNWGLVSYTKGNAYDGKEAVIASGTDQWGYATGGEAQNYGDFISSVRSTLQAILSALP